MGYGKHRIDRFLQGFRYIYIKYRNVFRLACGLVASAQPLAGSYGRSNCERQARAQPTKGF